MQAWCWPPCPGRVMDASLACTMTSASRADEMGRWMTVDQHLSFWRQPLPLCAASSSAMTLSVVFDPHSSSALACFWQWELIVFCGYVARGGLKEAGLRSRTSPLFSGLDVHKSCGRNEDGSNVELSTVEQERVCVRATMQWYFYIPIILSLSE